MESPSSFGNVLKKLQQRKQWEQKSTEKFNNAKCKRCGGNIVANGVSTVTHICLKCVNASLE